MEYPLHPYITPLGLERMMPLRMGTERPYPLNPVPVMNAVDNPNFCPEGSERAMFSM
jgi:hypothetical protein